MKTNCKIIYHEPDWTPNNYDITFNPEIIPSNIPKETGDNLHYRLQKLMPLTKKIHINLFTTQLTENNDLKLSANLRINNREVKLK